MIPNKSDRTVTGNLQGDRVRMSFAEGAESHLMALLTDMYSDPEKAIIREYATNALDSHIEAGNDAPIEVTLPSPLSPYLKIKDYGVGLSVEDIHQIYSKYGASTKRGTNEATGMLGIGCKSALTYASQFTVVAVQNGTRVTVAVSRDEDGSNTMTIVDTSATDEPNGVEVSIPARGGNQLDSKAAEFFQYWKPGTVLVNGKQPVTPEQSSLELTDTIQLIEVDRYRGSQSVIVMGNVPYPVGDHLDHTALGVPYGYAVIARVPTGSVDFAPSREALQMTKRTRAKLDDITAEFKRELISAVERKIQDAPTRSDAVKAVNKWKRLLGSNMPLVFKYKGQQLPTQIAPPTDGKKVRVERRKGQFEDMDYRMLLTNSGNYSLSSATTARALDISYMERTVWITDYTPVKLTATHKKKMRMWASENKLDPFPGNFALVNFPLDTTWLDTKRVVSWNDVNQLQLPSRAKNPSIGARLPGSYDVIQRKKDDSQGYSRREVEGKDIDMSKPVFFVHGNVMVGYEYGVVLDTLHKQYTLICLPANRLDKFKRDNPSVKRVQDVIDEAYNKWLSNLTADERLALHINDHHYALPSYGRALAGHASSLKDPELVRLVKVCSLDVESLLKVRRRFAGFGKPYKDQSVKLTNPFNKYPLYDSSVALKNPNHVISYMNAIHEGKL